MGDDHTCRMKGICTILIKMMVRELKDVRCVPQLKKKLISIGALDAHRLKGTLGDGVLKMLKGLMVVLKAVRHNNTYYLKDNIATGQVADSEGADGDSSQCFKCRLTLSKYWPTYHFQARTVTTSPPLFEIAF